MAFNPERLSLLVQPIGDAGMRWFNYQTDESQATLTGAGFIPNASAYGIRVSDLIFVIRNRLRWRDPPLADVPHKTVCGRWSRLGLFRRVFAKLAARGRRA